LAEDKVLVD